MKDEQINIINESGDKDYFTIIPNLAINHSTAIDRSLYVEMKRFSGERGVCFATMETMRKRLKIGKTTFRNALKYLIEKKWIEYAGMIKGKTHPVRAYKVLDIWKLNSDHYKKIGTQTALSPQKTKDRDPDGTMIGTETNPIRRYSKEDICFSPKGSKLMTFTDNVINNDDWVKFGEKPRQEDRKNKNKEFQLFLKYWISEFKKTKDIEPEINISADIAIYHSRSKKYSREDIKSIIEYFLSIDKSDNFPSISACFSADTINHWKKWKQKL
ncbi:MAG: helix-turn-helix domain-containing protein [Nanoarchaeota archaeon]